MVDIPLEDVMQIWDETEHSWAGLQQTLKEKKGKSAELDESVVEEILEAASVLEDTGERFPDTPEELHVMLSQE